MLEFIASNVTIIIIATFVIMIISAMLALSNAHEFGDETIAIIGGLITIICIFILGTLSFNTKGDYPISHAKWKTIYKNDLNADIKIAYNDFSDKHSLNTNQKQQKIKELQSTLEENNDVANIELTIIKGENSITKKVLLEKDNIIAKNIDPNNAKIVKIEYRPSEGTALKVFGVKGRPNKSDKDGEIRITFKSNQDKELEALFKN